MNIAPDWTLFVQVINFLILFGVLKWKLFGPVMKILEDREKKIKSDLEEAERSKEDAMKIKKDYADRLSAVEQEAKGIIQEAILQGDKVKADLVQKGREEAERIKKDGEAHLQLEKDKAEAELRKHVSGLAVDLASRLIKKNIDETSNSLLISEFIGEMK